MSLDAIPNVYGFRIISLSLTAEFVALPKILNVAIMDSDIDVRNAAFDILQPLLRDGKITVF